MEEKEIHLYGKKNSKEIVSIKPNLQLSEKIRLDNYYKQLSLLERKKTDKRPAKR